MTKAPKPKRTERVKRRVPSFVIISIIVVSSVAIVTYFQNDMAEIRVKLEEQKADFVSLCAGLGGTPTEHLTDKRFCTLDNGTIVDPATYAEFLKNNPSPE